MNIAAPSLALMIGLGICATGDAQTANITIFGSPCARYAENVPRLSVTAPPRLGTTIEIVYSGPNWHGGIAVVAPSLLIGFGSIAPVAIPATLLPDQPAGCTVQFSPHLRIPMAFIPHTGPFVDRFALTIPNAPHLAGLSFHAQWLAQSLSLAFPLTVTSVEVSEAATLTVGV